VPRSKSFPRTTFDTSASMNKYATNQYFHFMKKYTKKCLDAFVKKGGNGKYLFSLTHGILFNIVVPFKVWKKLHYFLKCQN
jgi:uroporphyrinogen-III decarboxylase